MVRSTAEGTPVLWSVMMGTGIIITIGLSLVGGTGTGISHLVSVFAMATGDLGHPAAKHVEEERVDVPVITQPRTMEGDSVLEVVAKLAIHRAVRSMAIGDLGDLGPPAPKHVEAEPSQSGATVTTPPQNMEGDSVLEVVLTAELAIQYNA